MKDIQVVLTQPIEGLREEDFERVLRHVLKKEAADLALNLVVLDDESIHELNRDHLAHDYPTDVIAFDLRDTGGPVGDTSDFGPDAEIYVSFETAEREASQRGLEYRSELLLYCIHGTLHLLGYDDHDEQDRKKMHARQRELLKEVGFETTD